MDGLAERAEEPSFRERFGDLLCSFQPQLFYLFVIEIILLVLALFSLVYIEPGTASYVILQIDFIILGATLTPTVLILYLCSRRDQQR